MNIRFQKLIIDFKKEQTDIVFEDFNYFYGKMGSGKSSIARLLDYCLGGDLYMTPALQNEFISVTLLLIIDDIKLSIERIRDSNQVIASWKSEEETIEIVLPVSESKGVVIPNTPVENLSDLLFYLSGVSPPKVRKSKTNDNAGLQRLSIRNLLWYCYLDQENIDNNFFFLDRDAHTYKRLASRNVLRFIVGFHQELVSELEIELDKIKEEKNNLLSSVRALREAIKETGISSSLDIEVEQNALDTETEDLNEEIEKIKRGRLNELIPHGVLSLKKRARNLENDIQYISQGINEIENQIDKDESFLHELEMLSVKNARSISARAVLSGVDYENCPRCAQMLPSREKSVCAVCGQEENFTDKDFENQAKVIQQDANDRISELNNLIQNYREQLVQMKINKEKLIREKKKIDTQINELMQEYDSTYLSSILVKEKRLSEIESTVEHLHVLAKLPEKANSLQEEADEKHIEEQNLREKLSEAREKAESDTRNRDKLQDYFLNSLVSAGVPGIKATDSVTIESPWLLPEVSNPSTENLTVTTFSNIGSGGKKTMFKSCFAIASHLLATEINAILPSVLIIDSPMKNISERENKDQFNKFYEYLYRLSVDELSDTQIIIIDKEYKAPPEDIKLNIMKRHMMPESDEFPPLIKYYRGP